MRFGMVVAAGWLALVGADAANAACSVRYFASIPVTVAAGGVMASAVINGQPIDVEVDSGAFFSFMRKETAQSLGLLTKPISASFGFSSSKGGLTASLGYADSVKFGQQSIVNVRFIVFSGPNAPQSVIIGQNILTIHDAEFDLKGGVIRLTNPDGCTGQPLTYWAQPDRVRSLAIEAPEGELDRQTFGKVLVNGVPLRAMFSTGRRETMLLPRALPKIGRAAGAGDEGKIIKVDKIDIGGEVRKDADIGVAESNLGEYGQEIDMIVGVDFFLTHRVYVSNGRKMLFFTANDATPMP